MDWAGPTEPLTFETFPAWEDQQEERHEFDGETVQAMIGGNRLHQRICHNLESLLLAGLNQTHYDVVRDFRTAIKPSWRYPDIAIVAGLVADEVRTITDAIIIFEVLSPNTEATDRTAKLVEYARLSSLQAYILIRQDRPEATIFSRVRPDEPLQATQTISQGLIKLPVIDVRLTLESLYARR